MRNSNDPDRPLLCGVGICPGTPVEAVEPLLDDVEMALLLAVNPGWGGQSFIPATARRLERLRTLIGQRKILTILDGGVLKTTSARSPQ